MSRRGSRNSTSNVPETGGEECPEGRPDCPPIEGEEECPEGNTGTPPDCTPPIVEEECPPGYYWNTT